jgi:uncharacterized membrane protein YeaQ/YmgE (transglycosylase-associated protein family)
MWSFILSIVIGAVAGWIAGNLSKGGGSGFWVNLIVGIIGGVLGGWIFDSFEIRATSIIGNLITAMVSAAILLWIVSLFIKK